MLSDAEYSVVTDALLPLPDQRLAATHELGHYIMHQRPGCEDPDGGAAYRARPGLVG